jgi:hypothetical protein
MLPFPSLTTPHHTTLQYTLSHYRSDVCTKYQEASKIVNLCLSGLVEQCVAGAKVVDLCQVRQDKQRCVYISGIPHMGIVGGTQPNESIIFSQTHSNHVSLERQSWRRQWKSYTPSKSNLKREWPFLFVSVSTILFATILPSLVKSW